MTALWRALQAEKPAGLLQDSCRRNWIAANAELGSDLVRRVSGSGGGRNLLPSMTRFTALRSHLVDLALRREVSDALG